MPATLEEDLVHGHVGMRLIRRFVCQAHKDRRRHVIGDIQNGVDVLSEQGGLCPSTPKVVFRAERGVANIVGLATERTEILSFFSKDSVISVAKKGLAHPFSHSSGKNDVGPQTQVHCPEAFPVTFVRHVPIVWGVPSRCNG